MNAEELEIKMQAAARYGGIMALERVKEKHQTFMFKNWTTAGDYQEIIDKEIKRLRAEIFLTTPASGTDK